jgi:hypothetical protein
MEFVPYEQSKDIMSVMRCVHLLLLLQLYL